jgi:hypothetical protein
VYCHQDFWPNLSQWTAVDAPKPDAPALSSESDFTKADKRAGFDLYLRFCVDQLSKDGANAIAAADQGGIGCDEAGIPCEAVRCPVEVSGRDGIRQC